MYYYICARRVNRYVRPNSAPSRYIFSAIRKREHFVCKIIYRVIEHDFRKYDHDQTTPLPSPTTATSCFEISASEVTDDAAGKLHVYFTRSLLYSYGDIELQSSKTVRRLIFIATILNCDWTEN